MAQVEIDLIHKGIKTKKPIFLLGKLIKFVEIDLIHKGIKTDMAVAFDLHVFGKQVEIDLIHKGIKT